MGFILFATASRTSVGSTKPLIQCVSVFVSVVLKRPGYDADHSPPSSAEVKNTWSYTPTHAVSLQDAVVN